MFLSQQLPGALQRRTGELAMQAVLQPNQGYRNFPRNPRRTFRHDEALRCIQRDYLGIASDPSTPIFKDRSFEMMFRLSKARIQQLLEDVMNHVHFHPFYSCNREAGKGNRQASLDAKTLLPLKTFAFGVAPHAFSDYFQMSKPLASKCCHVFSDTIRSLYSQEYLRLPDANDLKCN